MDVSLALPPPWVVIEPGREGALADAGLPANALSAVEAFMRDASFSLLATLSIAYDTDSPARATLIIAPEPVDPELPADERRTYLHELAMPMDGASTGVPVVTEVGLPSGAALRTEVVRAGFRDDRGRLPLTWVVRYVVSVSADLAAVLHFETDTPTYLPELVELFETTAAQLTIVSLSHRGRSPARW